MTSIDSAAINTNHGRASRCKTSSTLSNAVIGQGGRMSVVGSQILGFKNDFVTGFDANRIDLTHTNNSPYGGPVVGEPLRHVRSRRVQQPPPHGSGGLHRDQTVPPVRTGSPAGGAPVVARGRRSLAPT